MPEIDDTSDATTIATADEFAREQTTAAKRAFDLQVRQESLAHGQVLARVWAPVVALVLIGFLSLVGFIVHQVSSEHSAERRAQLDRQSRQVTVWCYADPNSDRGTSTITGTVDQVRGFCPDQRQPTYPSNP